MALKRSPHGGQRKQRRNAAFVRFGEGRAPAKQWTTARPLVRATNHPQRADLGPGRVKTPLDLVESARLPAMGRLVEGGDRRPSFLLPDSVDDYVTEDNPVRVVDLFIDELDLGALGFAGMQPAATNWPAHHPSTLLKIYLYGYLNRVPSSRRLVDLKEAVRQLAGDNPTGQ